MRKLTIVDREVLRIADRYVQLLLLARDADPDCLGSCFVDWHDYHSAEKLQFAQYARKGKGRK